jgi:pimeloyl-ACP methyl ester carboxylesterase
MTLQSVTAHHLSRRALITTASVGIGTAAAGAAFSRSTLAAGTGRLTANAARLSTADAATASLDALAQTPLGEQLAWLLAAVNDGGASLTEADVAAHMAPALLAVVPPAQVIGLVQGLAGGYGALTLQGVTRPPTGTQAVALVSAAVGLQLALPIAIEAAAPHRITGLKFYPSPSGDGVPLLPATGDGVAMGMDAPLVDIGGRGLYRADEGTDGPTVVFEAGLTDSDATWSGVIPAVAAFAKVVGYDRPNTTAGASDAAPMPRTADDVVADLNALLGTAAGEGPYVLVGHSTGGLFARLYASQYPDQVAGLVLVDASHEEQDVRRQDMVAADLFAAEQLAIQGNSEGIDLGASFSQMSAARTATPLRPMPLVVLSAGQDDPAFFPAGWPMDAEALLHDELQADLAGLVPDGRHVIAEHSGHYVQQSQPDLVVAAIRDVVQAVRDPGSWGTAAS